MSHQPFEFRPSGSIEFEQIAPATLIEQAQAPVDDAMDGDPLSVNFGRRKDHKPLPAERMLAGTTIDWLIAFSADARPKALCERYPHVANRLAQDWPDKASSALSLRVLIDDPRWGGAGFPAQVQGELQRLLK
ncbi:MAG: hypothetical protein Q8L49_11040 [Burkholderiaceae bacterium]|nr:hypothetical protein [Burkholderiaceae bacterium]